PRATEPPASARTTLTGNSAARASRAGRSDLFPRSGEDRRHGRRRKAELIRNEFVRVPELRVPEDLFFSLRERAIRNDDRIIFVGQEIAAPVALELLDERPSSGNEPAPKLDGAVRVSAFGARLLDTNESVLKGLTCSAMFCLTRRMLDLAALR